MKRFFILYSLVLVGFFACDKPDCPYVDERLCDPVYRDSIEGGDGGNGGDTLAGDTGTVVGNTVCYSPAVFENYEKATILEDFTGFRCTNCLPANQTANNLQEEWGSQLVVIAYHVTTQFAAPIADPPEPFSTDFRTPEGETLVAEFQIPGLPNGVVSRTDFGTGLPQQAASWADNVFELLQDEPTGFVRFRDVEISSDQTQISFRVAARIFGEVDEEYSLVAGIIEDKVIEAQKDGEETIFPYEHNHMFRANFNGTYGAPVFSAGETFDDNCATLFEFQGVLEEEWNVSNCYIFAYLMKTESLEVVQATKFSLAD
jgi:thiol-disulfide isomerase/thioredoxin